MPAQVPLVVLLAVLRALKTSHHARNRTTPVFIASTCLSHMLSLPLLLLMMLLLQSCRHLSS
jgi:hypothetical protein